MATGPASCLSVSTMPAVHRWRPAGCATSQATPSRSAPPAVNPRPDQPRRRGSHGRGRHRHRRQQRKSSRHGGPRIDVVITMGCGDTCPFYPGKRYEDWELDDPAGKGVDSVRPIRDEIRRRVEQLLGEPVPA